MPTNANFYPYLLNPFSMDTTSPATTSTSTPLPDDQVLASTRHGSGSIGPFFAVMSAIIVLLVISCILGWFCGYRVEGPDSWYDCLGWCQRRCRRRGCGVSLDLDPKVGESKRLPVPPAQP